MLLYGSRLYSACRHVFRVSDAEFTDNRNLNHRTDAPWGLERLSFPEKLVNQNTGSLFYHPLLPISTFDVFLHIFSDLTFKYRYDATAGSGVDIYVLGMLLDHPSFIFLTLYFADTGKFTAMAT